MALAVQCDARWAATVNSDSDEWKHRSDVDTTQAWLGWEVEKDLASSLLVKLLDAFSEPAFQARLQALILAARKSDNSKRPKIVPGRAALIQKVHANVFSDLKDAALIQKVHENVFSDFEGMCEIRMCKMIAPFVAEEEISYQLSLIDELLALAPNVSIDYVKLVCESSSSASTNTSSSFPTSKSTTTPSSSLPFSEDHDHLFMRLTDRLSLEAEFVDAQLWDHVFRKPELLAR
eukprot:CAMPEP_0169194102 /NCGR_PEP_ID=MMETSP1016-20121227/6521_1 /TAXON_ID=342587 /ORGANISM="Karlodinium micrum, Strain CCMP2283" /LENGTH=233 /DNA_ID=CAMNT_0009270591 /DNA_START=40 /DNA_END=742 /DNA_ORIENTATION=-